MRSLFFSLITGLAMMVSALSAAAKEPVYQSFLVD